MNRKVNAHPPPLKKKRRKAGKGKFKNKKLVNIYFNSLIFQFQHVI